MSNETILTLKQWRNLRDLSQKELANEANVTERSIANYEKDVKNLQNAKYATVKRLADALDVKVDNIFLSDTSEKPKLLIN
ncbi:MULTISPECIES: helix-turn-helix transcriptional regulator [Staphylococcus]|uniref:helix-turn-helix transcriptional regulator n=1 Tax=Staphylococcus TaxID=1279 RepID=UPI001BE91DA2|nr:MULTISPECIES: helix-turn-helix transcriptional regulator [Staphylococcus]MBT2823113.1 helix-turn-helix transcriptional regulator [Staphylococcus coagulans]MBT2852354.1 helix-turn-helix transcriptional regulator [Staphylococcus coagulans]MBT2860495.1 helix-turn-helix transcriptional regulator [Staphylococcus coagulans]MBU3873185.1 helix-turn-helix transcriptional regulator [Staphylococcus coagulans]UXR54370.1 helix-turn-helix domain-containing protein [Staphylococcus schleiferi]